MSPFLLVILFSVIAYKLYEYLTAKTRNIPPALPWLPIVGSYWHLLWGNYNFPHKTVEYYTRKLKSKLVSCYLGQYFTIIANDHDTIKEILSREEFDGRLTEAFVVKARAFGKKLGIFFTDGSQWHEQRRFALRHMRDFGFGRRQEKFESDIMEELAQLVDTLKNGPINDSERELLKDGKALFPDVLYPFSANAIWIVMFGEKFNRSEHDKLVHICRSAIMFQRAADTTGGAIFQRPFLRHFGNMFGFKNMMIGNYRTVDFIKEQLEIHKRSHDDDNDRGLVDRYLNELRKRDEMSTFSEEQLIITVLDFLFPALSALPVTIMHCMKLLMHHPEVMKKVQTEIDTVVGTGRLVNWEDRKNLKYTEATIREALRYETLTPFGVIHRCKKDTTLSGYEIPKDTVVITNLAGMHEDRDFWGDPENFRPERFLDSNGELIKDPTFPFGFGHRLCAGETFARYNIFGLFAVLIQNFNLSFVEGQPNELEDKLPGLIVTARDAWIGVEPRI